MRASLLPPKVARLVHANRASRLAVLAWRWRTMKAVRCPGHRGLAVVAQDEATFVHDAVAGVKCGSPVGVPVDVAVFLIYRSVRGRGLLGAACPCGPGQRPADSL